MIALERLSVNSSLSPNEFGEELIAQNESVLVRLCKLCVQEPRLTLERKDEHYRNLHS